jgi:hypothetical protein
VIKFGADGIHTYFVESLLYLLYLLLQIRSNGLERAGREQVEQGQKVEILRRTLCPKWHGCHGSHQLTADIGERFTGSIVRRVRFDPWNPFHLLKGPVLTRAVHPQHGGTVGPFTFL